MKSRFSKWIAGAAAAAAVAGSEYAVDGWRLWRVGDDGPALADLRDV